jgi:hypothetical protein
MPAHTTRPATQASTGFSYTHPSLNKGGRHSFPIESMPFRQLYQMLDFRKIYE